MIGQSVMCRASGQAFEVPPDHRGDKVQCPFCGGAHPAPPIIPPAAERPRLIAAPPPIVESRRASTVRKATFFFTAACGIAVGVMAGLAIAAATDSPMRESLRSDDALAALTARVEALESALAARSAAPARFEKLEVEELEAKRIVLDAGGGKKDEDGFERFATLDEYGMECFGIAPGDGTTTRYAVLRPGYLEISTEEMKRRAILDAGWNGKLSLQLMHRGDVGAEIGVGKTGKALAKFEQ